MANAVKGTKQLIQLFNGDVHCDFRLNANLNSVFHQMLPFVLVESQHDLYNTFVNLTPFIPSCYIYTSMENPLQQKCDSVGI